jgi:hypothetical protein
MKTGTLSVAREIYFIASKAIQYPTAPNNREAATRNFTTLRAYRPYDHL